MNHFLMDHMDFLTDLIFLLIPIMDLEIRYQMEILRIIIIIIIISISIQHLDLVLLHHLYSRVVGIPFTGRTVLLDILVVPIITIIHIIMIPHGLINIMVCNTNMVIVFFLDIARLVLPDHKNNTKKRIGVLVFLVAVFLFVNFSA